MGLVEDLAGPRRFAGSGDAAPVGVVVAAVAAVVGALLGLVGEREELVRRLPAWAGKA